ncbi:MAG: response regulator [Oscillochloris sp.]|nr:response regulator [Oscillochloris sp.]
MSKIYAPVILIVEDDSAIARMIAAMLRGEGYQVQIAPDAETAIAELPAVRPALITLDLSLPGLSAAAFLEQLRAAPHTATLAVILITAEQAIRPDIRALADDLLPKPFGMDELIAQVQATMSRAGSGWMQAVA